MKGGQPWNISLPFLPPPPLCAQRLCKFSWVLFCTTVIQCTSNIGPLLMGPFLQQYGTCKPQLHDFDVVAYMHYITSCLSTWPIQSAGQNSCQQFVHYLFYKSLKARSRMYYYTMGKTVISSSHKSSCLQLITGHYVQLHAISTVICFYSLSMHTCKASTMSAIHRDQTNVRFIVCIIIYMYYNYYIVIMLTLLCTYMCMLDLRKYY